MVMWKTVLLMLMVAGTSWTQVAGPARHPLNREQIAGLLAGGVASERLAVLVRERGISFEPTDDYLQALQNAGAEEVFLTTLRARRASKRVPAVLPTSASSTPSGLKDALAEYYREGVRPQPDEPGARRALGAALQAQGDLDGAVAEYRELLRLKPGDADGHAALGMALCEKQDWKGAVAEDREALRLKPGDVLALSAPASKSCGGTWSADSPTK